MKKFFKTVLLTVTAMIVGTVAYAQVTTSSLAGQISEEGSEPLAGATVVAVHVPSGTQYYGITNEAGRYTIQGMRSGGPYKVEISYLGMNTVEYNDIVLKLGEPFELNANLASANELEAVTVVGESTFASHMTGAGQSFSLSSVENAPKIDRSVYDIVKFTPQATVNKDGGISFAGANNRYNSFQIDGAMANDTFGLSSAGTNGGQTGANPVSIDAIEEIQVVVAPFDVRQSGFTGGAINAITKSGTNTVKGSGYTYHYTQDFIGTSAGPRSEYEDVNEPRTKYETQSSEIYGFTLGGPIIKNKLFFFGSLEYTNKAYPNIYTPLNKSYESYIGQNKDSQLLKNAVNVNGQQYDHLTADLAQAVIDHYTNTYAPDAVENILPHMKNTRSFSALARLDWNINDANKLMFRYQLNNAFMDKYSSNLGTYYFGNSSYKQMAKTHTLVAELNSRLGDNLQNMLRVSAVMERDHREVPYNGACMYIRDNITIDLGTEYSSGANSMDSNTFTITDNLSWFVGNHEITLGTHNEIYTFNNLFLQYAYGEYIFDSLADFFNNNANKFEYRYADPAVTGSDDPHWRATTYAAQFGAYLQDEWKPSRNFTLTYGIRVDVPMYFNKPTENPEFNVHPIALANDEYVGVVPKPQPLFSPRVGFRWFLNDSHTSLLRGGAGLFTGRVPFVWISNAYNNTGMETKQVSVDNPGWMGNAAALKNPNPYEAVVQSGLAAAGGKATINTLNENFKYPQVFRVNLGYEQNFAYGWKFTFDGLFSKTLNNLYVKNLALTSNNVVYAVNSEVGPSAPYYTVDDSYAAVIALQNTNKGYTYSLTGKLEKHFKWGLDLMAAYTFTRAKSVNDGKSSVAKSNWTANYCVDPNSPDEVSYSLFDKPHKIIALASYTSPIYGRIFSTNVTVSYTAGSGQRYSYTMSETPDFNGDGQKGNNLMYIPTANEIGEMNWTDPADAVLFEKFIRQDPYLNSHRGQWSERFGGIQPFEHHFDVHFSQNIFFDPANKRKVEIMLDILNFSNLLNREWGVYYSPSWNRNILALDKLTADRQGNYTPTYSFNPRPIYTSDFESRWRMQLGVRLTF